MWRGSETSPPCLPSAWRDPLIIEEPDEPLLRIIGVRRRRRTDLRLRHMGHQLVGLHLAGKPLHLFAPPAAAYGALRERRSDIIMTIDPGADREARPEAEARASQSIAWTRKAGMIFRRSRRARPLPLAWRECPVSVTILCPSNCGHMIRPKPGSGKRAFLKTVVRSVGHGDEILSGRSLSCCSDRPQSRPPRYFSPKRTGCRLAPILVKGRGEGQGPNTCC